MWNCHYGVWLWWLQQLYLSEAIVELRWTGIFLDQVSWNDSSHWCIFDSRTTSRSSIGHAIAQFSIPVLNLNMPHISSVIVVPVASCCFHQFCDYLNSSSMILQIVGGAGYQCSISINWSQAPAVSLLDGWFTALASSSTARELPGNFRLPFTGILRYRVRRIKTEKKDIWFLWCLCSAGVATYGYTIMLQFR